MSRASSLAPEATLLDRELNGKPMAGMAVQLDPRRQRAATAPRRQGPHGGAVAAASRQDVAWSIPYDTTPFVQISVEEVIDHAGRGDGARLPRHVPVPAELARDADPDHRRADRARRAPASACGSLGFSINVLTLFGMVLAIGILVDDAIVVIENVERIMARGEACRPTKRPSRRWGRSPPPIIGITLVLIAVFVPMAFFPGSTGGIYRQFSVTLAISIAFSALLALTLTPALCATLLKPHDDAASPQARSGSASTGSSPASTRCFARTHAQL